MRSMMKYWIWLSLSGEPSTAWKLLSRFETPERVFQATEEEMTAIEGIAQRRLTPFLDKSLEKADAVLRDCERLGIHISTWLDADYPARLRAVNYPPMALYFLGRPLRLDDYRVIAMAGTRRCSGYGRKMSAWFAVELARRNALVLTGVANGCDEEALEAVMNAGYPSAVLLPGGVDVPFSSPQAYRRIAERSTLISPFPPGTPNAGQNFHYRNYLLAALSSAVLIVEAGEKSGCRNVAARGLDLNRPVFAVPANLDQPTAVGSNQLICSGLALPVMDADTILQGLRTTHQPLQKGRQMPPPARKTTPPEAPSVKKIPEKTDSSEKKVDSSAGKHYIDLRNCDDYFTDDEQSVLKALSAGPCGSEELTARSGVPAHRIQAAVTTLTIGEHIRELSGGRFELAAELVMGE